MGRFIQMIQLNPITISDAINLHHLRTNPEVAQFIIRDTRKSVPDIEKFILEINSNPKNRFFKIESLGDEQFAGIIILKNIDFQNKYAEVGYELLPEYQGKGVMSEALGIIIHLAFTDLGLETLEAYTHHQNARSRKLLEKMYFTFIETKKDPVNSNNVIYRLKKKLN